MITAFDWLHVVTFALGVAIGAMLVRPERRPVVGFRTPLPEAMYAQFQTLPPDPTRPPPPTSRND